MTDRIVLGASRKNFFEVLNLACERGVGMELQAFAYPETLDGDWEGLVTTYREALKDVPGDITMHGPFIDMASGTIDPLIRNAVRRRIKHAIQIGTMIKAKTIVFHANFIASLRSEAYRLEWTGCEVAFWGEIAEYSEDLGITLVLENMWEYSPALIGTVLEQVNSPVLRACLDVGHVQLYSDLKLDDWLRTMGPWLAHIHMNNTPGQTDDHRALDDGIIDYRKVFPKLRKLPLQPTWCLEIDRVDDLRRSLDFLGQ